MPGRTIDCDGNHIQANPGVALWAVHHSILLPNRYIRSLPLKRPIGLLVVVLPSPHRPVEWPVNRPIEGAPLPAPYQRPTWGSDVMVDAMRAFGFPYLALNPGSSFRGLHDSLVNYADDEMQMIECQHEEIAVALAHGYAKASGRPMGVVLHNVVGLLHGAMAIYYAYIDRVPVVIFGGSGPAAYDRRRPNIDWIHGANVQGNAVRDYTKWDYEPRSLDSVPASIARGYRI